MNRSSPESVILCAGQLRVVFQWHTDRWSHQIEVANAAGHWQPALVSLEGSSTDDWPTSPALQSLHVEESPSAASSAAGNAVDGAAGSAAGNSPTKGQTPRRVLLLVGMAGRSHWSASVEADPTGSRLLFDVACRLSVEPLRLGSCYRRGPAAAECRLSLGHVGPGQPGQSHLSPASQASQALATSAGPTASPVRLTSDDSTSGNEALLDIVAGEQLKLTPGSAQTVRWQYQIEPAMLGQVTAAS